MSRPSWKQDGYYGVRHRSNPCFKHLDFWEFIGLATNVRKRRQAKRKRREVYPETSGRCRLILADVLSFDVGAKFGFVYSASGGIQTGSADDLRGILRSGADHLDETGVLAFDVSSPAALRCTRVFTPEERELPGGRVVIRFVTQTYNEETDTTSFHLIFKEHIPGRTTTVTTTESGKAAVITPEAIEDALDYAGLELVSMHGDFKGTRYGADSEWIVVVAGRKAPAG